VLFIIVLIRLFQKEGVGLGILGLICGIYTFIWGWQHHKELGITGVMTAWTVLVVIGLIINVMRAM
jgi:hypothetical protein